MFVETGTASSAHHNIDDQLNTTTGARKERNEDHFQRSRQNEGPSPAVIQEGRCQSVPPKMSQYQ